ncbi:MAG: flavin oxidoreductase, partial [Oscillospiraceae bacterium]|nr:flavin oxidoreductase [Oscillospiraceae bacterium]
IIEEFPVTMECELAEIVQTENLHAVVGRIVNTSADEKVLNEKGKVEISKLNALIFDQFQAGYYVTGKRVGQAWGEGKELMK